MPINFAAQVMIGSLSVHSKASKNLRKPTHKDATIICVSATLIICARRNHSVMDLDALATVIARLVMVGNYYD